MIEARCFPMFMSCFSIVISTAYALHPVAHSLTPIKQQTNDISPSDGSSEEKHDIHYFMTDGSGHELQPGDEHHLDTDNTVYELDNDKRGFDRNYLRFGRNYDAEKRGADRNFLRFGRNQSPLVSALYEPSELTEEEKKSTRNFLRFGRGPERNFLRFGRGPLEVALGLKEEEDPEEISKRGDDRNFLRFGKASERNFLRFGRSTNMQRNELCKDCAHDTQVTSLPISIENRDSTSKQNRVKRSLSSFYDDVLFIDPMTPMPWTDGYNGYAPEPNTQEKRGGHSRNFLRYGRDPLDLHFLRFGKRGSEESLGEHRHDDEHMTRYGRARASKNFIRFG